MEAGFRHLEKRQIAIGAVLVALALMLLAPPGRAGAGIITPHVAAPETVTPHEVAPPPAPEAESAPEAAVAPEPDYSQQSEAAGEEGEEEAEASGGASPRRRVRKGAKDVPREPWEVPRPVIPASDSPACNYECHHVWLEWTLDEATRMISESIRLEAALGQGWRYENENWRKMNRALSLNDFKNEQVDYLMEHEFEHWLEEVVNAALPWGPAPSAESAIDTGRLEPCRNGNIVDANDEIEDHGSGSAACR